MDILLVNPPLDKPGQALFKIWKALPISIALIASCLEENGIDVEVIDAPTLEISKKELINLISKKNPSILGITSTSLQIKNSVELAKTAKSMIDTVTILGGPHASLDPETIKRCEGIDYIFVGPGEASFPKLVHELLEGIKLKKKVIFGEKVKNLDDLPIPAYHLFPMEKYEFPLTLKRSCYVMSSRGCPFKCIYCSVPKRVLFKSAERVINEIQLLQDKYKVEWIQFGDPVFTLDKKHTFSICEKIMEEKIDIKWGAQTRAELINKNLIKRMYKAGCREITFGIESGSYRVRQIIKKGTKNKTIKKSLKLCRDVGIETYTPLLFGLPTETVRDMKKTINFICKANPTYITCNTVNVYPGTELFPIAVERGVIKENAWAGYLNGGPFPKYIPQGITYDQLLEFCKEAYRKFYLRKETLKYIHKVPLKTLIKLFFDFKLHESIF